MRGSSRRCWRASFDLIGLLAEVDAQSRRARARRSGKPETTLASDARRAARDGGRPARQPAESPRPTLVARHARARVRAGLLAVQGRRRARDRGRHIVTGCNVENATYGLTICAERVALVKALSDGHRDFTRIAVVADTDDADAAVRPVPPAAVGVLRRHRGHPRQPRTADGELPAVGDCCRCRSTAGCSARSCAEKSSACAADAVRLRRARRRSSPALRRGRS